MLNESEIESLQILIDKYGYDAVAEGLSNLCPDEEPGSNCAHEWTYTGTAYGGDDDRWFGEGRGYCAKCGADGDA